MKNLLFSLALLISCGTIVNAQKSISPEIQCEKDDISFYENPDFLYSPKYFITIPKRDGVKSYSDLKPSELKEIKREARKYNCCIVVCDFDYQTEHSLKKLSEDGGNEKQFYFYIANKIEDADEQEE